MEDEKKKKKNKKKKNKQHKASEGPAVGVGEEIASLDENHLSTQTHGNQDSITDVQNGDVQKENVDLNGHCANGTDSVSAALINIIIWHFRMWINCRYYLCRSYCI